MLVTTRKKVIRFRYLKSAAMGNKSFLKEVIGIFILQIPEDLVLLEKSLLEKNWNTLADYAHKMKSSINVMGMKESERLLIEIETASIKTITPDEKFIAAKIKTLKKKCIVAVDEAKELMIEWKL